MTATHRHPPKHMFQRHLRSSAAIAFSEVGYYKNNGGHKEHAEHYSHCHIIQLQIISACRQN